ncbi:class I SAM-dependent methyltransferase [Nocardioides sediminis]|uniref:class I SAM-dependent methyltransferase n=1 Tax=Nocardioides sediminis TaxID=433648 RepID=UPI000D311BF3|nr:class I SAM-dependent methyltransferase [Nocardioides sediminis]
MSHPEQLGFFSAVASANRDVVAGSRVIEIGAYAVNGTMRSYFSTAADYVGVDLVEGPGVDVVGFGHEIDHEDGSYDVATSGECFEHDPHWRQTFANMVRLTRPGGLVAFTCASSGRPEHGTRRTRVADSPGTQFEGLDYYRNLTEADFADLDLAGDFSAHRFWRNPTSFDLYFAGVRAGTTEGRPTAVLPDEADVARLSGLMSLPHRALRLPLRGVRRFVTDEGRYQDVILPYWQGLLHVQRRLGGVGGRAE